MPSVSTLKNIMVTLLLMVVAVTLNAAPRITVDVAHPGAGISPTMYGVFFEDINFGADGGLYAELVKNRSFEFDRPLMGWRIIRRTGARGDVLIFNDDNRPRNPRYARIRVEQQGQGFALVNEGFRGMGIRAGAGYRFSVQARSAEGNISGVHIELVDSTDQPLGEARIGGFAREWKTYECELTAKTTAAKGRMNLWVEGTGQLEIDMISLFPEDTWKGRKNGLRRDLVQMLADMKPGFLRFPGGCIVEGYDLSQRYQWKNTIGPVDQRVVNINRWNFEFSHRPTPDYYQSYGLGFYEYFLLAEDLGAEPLPILNCGMACQFNAGEVVPLEDLQPYIQDALDCIEFANGPADSKWGSVRTQMGHPEPFHMKMIGVGNEQWGSQYIDRYKPFVNAVKNKYPDMQIVAATGSDPTIFPNGEEEVQFLWNQWRQLRPEIVDEHFYRNPEWFLENADRYSEYDRNGPHVFVGEYAAQSIGVGSPDNRNSWECALYEAAFMTGLERNADLVTMSCYAPLFAHEDAWQWRPDLIWFDNLHVYGSANYYVQQLFSLYTGTRLLNTQVADAPKLDARKKGLYASATLDDETHEVIVKVVNATNAAQISTLDLQGAIRPGKSARVILLTSDALSDENSLQEPKKIYPEESSTTITGSLFTYNFRPLSLTILRVPVQ